MEAVEAKRCVFAIEPLAHFGAYLKRVLGTLRVGESNGIGGMTQR